MLFGEFKPVLQIIRERIKWCRCPKNSRIYSLLTSNVGVIILMKGFLISI